MRSPSVSYAAGYTEDGHDLRFLKALTSTLSRRERETKAATGVFTDYSRNRKADRVAFLKCLTDERLRWERAPFDHPQLLVPHGHKKSPNPQHSELAQDLFLTIPAVGKNGKDAALGAIKPFQYYLQP